jgi:signal peptidase I
VSNPDITPFSSMSVLAVIHQGHENLRASPRFSALRGTIASTPETCESRMQTLKRLPRIASVVAFVFAGIVILAGLLGPIIVLPFAMVPLCAGIGILRNRVWSAYGFATYFFAQLPLFAVILLQPGSSTGPLPRVVVTALGSLGLGVLFLFAGRSLAASGAVRSRAWPWIVATVLFTAPFFFVHTFEIPSGAMANTLVPGDRILAQMFPLRPPERGQMVLFISPTERNVILIKRVIAVPGDHLRIAKRLVILNGAALDEKYATHATVGVEFYPEDFPNEIELPGCAEGHEMLSRQVVNGEIVVPPGSYFALGDNREDSLDSRCWGFVHSGNVIGKPFMIYDSIEQTAEHASDPSLNWFGRRRWARLFKAF